MPTLAARMAVKVSESSAKSQRRAKVCVGARASPGGGREEQGGARLLLEDPISMPESFTLFTSIARTLFSTGVLVPKFNLFRLIVSKIYKYFIGKKYEIIHGG